MKYLKLIGWIALAGVELAGCALLGGWTGGKIGELIADEFMS